MNVKDFAGATPHFRLETYFAGHTRAWGMFEDRFGTLRRQFVVDIDGTWNGTELILDERFRYTDGETDRRVWTIRPDGPNGYVGRAGDVLGEARGAAYGNALNWTYRMNLAIGGREVEVRFDDWMFLSEDGVLLNRATVTKFGIELGTATIFFQKDPVPADGTASPPSAETARQSPATPPVTASR
ncbi:hypothetical protein GCM10011505_38990 [Tistrella bauzanensis]|uniref:DUF3833 domain-containing protein n=2 Tax=Tistrella bauzanensis TaxID=657419 RepID=A0ABQ1IX95_9PROT|nr:hypothetical protein GCM10011505_38990 [Tistrella bauzanensis]